MYAIPTRTAAIAVRITALIVKLECPDCVAAPRHEDADRARRPPGRRLRVQLLDQNPAEWSSVALVGAVHGRVTRKRPIFRLYVARCLDI